MKYLITKYQYNILSEQIDLDDYDESDFLDAFVTIFRRWIKNKLGDSKKDYPFSLLVRKYVKNFIIDLLGEEYLKTHWSVGDVDDEDDDLRISRYDMARIAREIITKGLHSLPTLQKREKFTEKFKRHLDFIISNLNLPDFLELEYTENKPHVVDFKVLIDYPQMLKFDGNSLSFRSIENEITKKISSFMGIKIGNPIHGDLEINFEKPEYKNLDSWVKNVLNKEIKKHIRTLPAGKYLHSVRFNPEDNRAELNLVFKSDASWTHKRDLKSQVENYLWDELGYAQNRLRVDFA